MTANKFVDASISRPQSLHVVQNCWLSDLLLIVVIIIVL